LLIFGLGYTGLRLARECLARGWTVAGTVRSAAKADALRAEGIDALVFAEGAQLPAARLAGLTHVVDTTVPGPEGSAVLPEVCRLFDAGVCPAWAGVLSTTAVYGDCEGRWVDESAPLAPGSPQARARVAAEAGWQAWGAETATPVQIFRLPGIYGPGRSALDQVREGTARRIHRDGHRTSRVHVDDIVAALRLAIAAPAKPAIYNVADDEPAPNPVVVELACELLGAPLPPLERYEDLAAADPRRRFLKDRRLVSNAKLKAALGWTPRYPTYRDGLRAILAAEG